MLNELRLHAKKIVVTLVLSIGVVPAFADSEKSMEINGFVSAGLTFGGDKLGTAEYTDGETQDIDAGELFFFSGGAVWTMNDFQLQGFIGYYADQSVADNGDVSFVRFPLEFLSFWKQETFRLGGGLTYHLRPEFEIDIDGGSNNGTVDFDNALGFVMQGDYLFANGIALGLRYTAIDYEVSDFDAEEVNGNNIGIVLGYIF